MTDIIIGVLGVAVTILLLTVITYGVVMVVLSIAQAIAERAKEPKP